MRTKMHPLINSQHNPFADISAQTQETETYSYSGIGLFTFFFFFGGSLILFGYLMIKGWNLKVTEEVFLILWLSIVGVSFVYWPKSFCCNAEGLIVYYWMRPSQRLSYSKIFAIDVKFGRGLTVTIYQGERKLFCLFTMGSIRDSKKLVKTIVERANLTFQKGNDHTGEALFMR